MKPEKVGRDPKRQRTSCQDTTTTSNYYRIPKDKELSTELQILDSDHSSRDVSLQSLKNIQKWIDTADGINNDDYYYSSSSSWSSSTTSTRFWKSFLANGGVPKVLDFIVRFMDDLECVEKATSMIEWMTTLKKSLAWKHIRRHDGIQTLRKLNDNYLVVEEQGGSADHRDNNGNNDDDLRKTKIVQSVWKILTSIITTGGGHHHGVKEYGISLSAVTDLCLDTIAKLQSATNEKDKDCCCSSSSSASSFIIASIFNILQKITTSIMTKIEFEQSRLFHDFLTVFELRNPGKSGTGDDKEYVLNALHFLYTCCEKNSINIDDGFCCETTTGNKGSNKGAVVGKQNFATSYANNEKRLISTCLQILVDFRGHEKIVAQVSKLVNRSVRGVQIDISKHRDDACHTTTRDNKAVVLPDRKKYWPRSSYIKRDGIEEPKSSYVSITTTHGTFTYNAGTIKDKCLR